MNTLFIFVGSQMDQVTYTTTNKLTKELECDTLYVFVNKDHIRKSAIESYYVIPSLLYSQTAGDRTQHDAIQFLNLKDSWVNTMQNDDWQYWVLTVDGSTVKHFIKDDVDHEYYSVRLMRCKNKSIIDEIQSAVAIEDFTDFGP